MRIHSAGHILHEAVMRVASGITPSKGEHGSRPYIEYVGSIPIGKRHDIQIETDAIVQSQKPIETRFVTREQLEQEASWIPPKLPKNKPLRVIQVADFPPIPDGGTQVHNTSEVGQIEIGEIVNSSETVRVYYSVRTHEETQSKQDIRLTSQPAAEEDIGHLISMILAAQADALSYIHQTDAPAHQLRSAVLGPKSEFASLAKRITSVPKEEKKRVGIVISQVKAAIESAIDAQSHAQQPTHDSVDITAPGHIPVHGHIHPTITVIRQMNDIFRSLGFSVAVGPEIDTDEYNYDRVNLPMDHPARDLQDTLYVNEPIHLLRTQTSSVEAHILETVTPPYRFVIPGKVYRSEKANATNNSMFYQYQGLAVATDITMAHLKGTLDAFVHEFFGKRTQTRFRCKYYPEVEPGVGVDISCPFCYMRGCTVCKRRGWIEMLGAGMIHPNMFRRVGLDPQKYSGFAWGMGLDRIVMTRYGITDIRSLYNGDIGYKE